MPKQLKIADLNKLYSDAESCDKELFAEQRSNVLLIAGDHYSKKTSRLHGRMRDNREINDTQKLRLTKNYIHKVYRHYVANILSYAPGVTIVPNNDLELQDQKDAQLNKAVWENAKSEYRLNEKVRDWCQDFIGIGEVACKVFWDPNKGDFKGFGQKMDEGMEGEETPQLDESGQPMLDEEKPLFSGQFVFERVFGFNLMRAPGAKSMQESQYHIIRKMVDVSELKGIYAGQDDKLKMVHASNDETFIVFDQNKSEYTKAQDQCLVREYYWRPCMDYPNGYWAITTGEGILEEGELPYGIYPLVFASFDEFPTAPRGHSIIKQVRPVQAEINRASSQVAQHQITLGDDKLVYQSGAKMSPGTLLPGVRGIAYNGVIPPTVLPGRDGSQYGPYIDSEIERLFNIAEMQEESEQMQSQQDPFAALFASMKQMKKYAVYGEKFEQFLIDVCGLFLELAKRYLPDDKLIYAVGRSELVNVSEFRKTSKLCYQVKIEAKNETAETQLGKQLTMNHILQYVGTQLDKDQIGMLIRNMPYGNLEASARDLTLDSDLVMNDMLSLERGERPEVGEYDNHSYIVKRITSRMKEADFKFLDPQIRVNYVTYLKQHEKVLADQAQALKDAQNEYIPVSGPMVACDYYIPDPQDPMKSAKRVRIPGQAIQWLIDHIEKQGLALDQIEQMNQGAVADMASMVRPKNQTNQMAASQPSGPSMFQSFMGRPGPASPIGVS